MENIVFGVFIAFLLVCLVALFCAILIKLYITKIKKYNAIIYQKEIAQQKAVNEAILETQENTLTNISQELHDDAGQQLTYINFQLENLKLTNSTLTEDIAPVSKSITHLANSLRDLSHSISHQKIKDFTLIDSIKNEIDRLNKLKGLNCTFTVSKPFDYTFTENEKIILFRIFQEAVNNMLKHSKATSFEVSLDNNPEISLVFKDNGIGFSNENSNLNSTNGIENIKSRAELISFSCKIDSQISKGTSITLTKP